VNLIISSLIICGGLGFFVLREVRGTGHWSNDRWSLHTKLVLALTGALLAAGTVLILLLERWNPRTLGPLGWGEATLVAYFQAVTPRTAGFNTIAIGDMSQAALFVLIVLMFIGASPGSTGGGVKTTTFGVTVMALWATVRGDEEAVAFGRRIPAEVVSRAFFISLIAFLWVAMLGWVLLIVEQGDLLPTLFETTSAFGTVGLSMGRPGSVLSLAGHCSEAGKLLLAFMMFLGRVGPLTVAIALAARRTRARLRYPEGRVFIG
jgi:trk system potassium uptake protein TrkH